MRCLICGADDMEAKKLFCFPANLEKSRKWQESLGMKYSGETLQNFKICEKHFSLDSFKNVNTLKLKSDAVPKRWIIPTELPEENRGCSSEISSVASQTGIIEESLQQTQDHVEVTQIVEEASSEKAQKEDTEVMRSDSPLPSTSQISNFLTPTTSRQRIFRNIGNLSTLLTSPRKKKLIDIVHKREKQLRRIKIICKRKSHDLKALLDLSERGVVKNLFRKMPSVTANFMLSQLKNFKMKNLKGRRWTIEDKILSLCILKRSPKCYNLLRKFVALPNKKTVLTLLRRVQFSSGINRNLFEHLNDTVDSGLDRSCALLFDEIDIKENVQMDIGEDRIFGFEDFGDGKERCQIANKALVFMLVGLRKQWKQPVAFYFNHNGCNYDQLKVCLHEVLHAAKYFAKVDVVATICDMGTSNVKCLKEMGVAINQPYFLFENKKIFAMYDPPHLLKSTVSLFRKHDILLPVSIGDQTTTMEAKFADVRLAHEIDKGNPLIFRAMLKLKDTHMSPVMKYAMKVNIAAQVCSHTVASYIHTLIRGGAMESRAVATATFVKQVDNLFDSFNGRTLSAPDGKNLRCAVTRESPHWRYWAEAFETVQGWTYKRLSKSGTLKKSKPPSQIGWLTSLNAIREVWKYLKNLGFYSLNPRSLNQDPLENLFGAVRYGCGCGDNPTVQQFIGSLKSQILNGLANTAFKSKNCEDDDHILLSNLKNFLDINDKSQESTDQEISSATVIDEDTSLVPNLTADIAGDISCGSPKIFSVAYVAGFIIKGIRKKFECVLCDSKLLSSDLEFHNTFIANKEWSDSNRLTYPSEDFTIMVGCGITALENFLNKSASHPSIMMTSQNFLMSKLNFESLGCPVHLEEIKAYTTRSLCRIGIPWWCKRKNQEIKAERKERISKKGKIQKFRHE